jgi:hypothetical protein
MRSVVEIEEAYKLIREKSLQIYAESCTGSHANVDIREPIPLSLALESPRKFSFPFH